MSTTLDSSSLGSSLLDPSFYEVLFNRRDVRGQFTGEAIDPDALARVLHAAHHAPSVGFMQPWNFILIENQETRAAVHRLFMEAQEEAVEQFTGDRQAQYKKLKLEGILESSLNVCITCDRDRLGPVVLGRTHIKEMDLFSTVCAVQNFWLAARAENLGVGWVSIFDQQALKSTLQIPDHIVPIAYLCVGPVSEFNAKPDLEKAGWQSRMELSSLLYFDQWEQSASTESQTSLKDAVTRQAAFPKRYQR